MSDENKIEVEQLGDTLSNKELTDTLGAMSDLQLGHFAGVAEAIKGLACANVNESNDGTCRVYDAAIEAYDARLKEYEHRTKSTSPQR
jgi:hypothetical protein